MGSREAQLLGPFVCRKPIAGLAGPIGPWFMDHHSIVPCNTFLSSSSPPESWPRAAAPPCRSLWRHRRRLTPNLLSLVSALPSPSPSPSPFRFQPVRNLGHCFRRYAPFAIQWFVVKPWDVCCWRCSHGCTHLQVNSTGGNHAEAQEESEPSDLHGHIHWWTSSRENHVWGRKAFLPSGVLDLIILKRRMFLLWEPRACAWLASYFGFAALCQCSSEDSRELPSALYW